jgi:hypothetical protein
MMRSSAVSLALGYVVLGWSALVLFAAPLWYAWQAPSRRPQRNPAGRRAALTDVYRRDGAEA